MNLLLEFVVDVFEDWVGDSNAVESGSASA